jgi:hypothetical protein
MTPVVAATEVPATSRANEVVFSDGSISSNFLVHFLGAPLWLALRALTWGEGRTAASAAPVSPLPELVEILRLINRIGGPSDCTGSLLALASSSPQLVISLRVGGTPYRP